MLSLDNTESSECDYFGLACYGEDNLDSKTLNQFSITNFSVTFYADTSNKVVKKILFPATIIETDEYSFLQIEAGDKYPIISTRAEGISTTSSLIEFIFRFYSDSQWYTAQNGVNGEIIVLLRPNTQNTNETIFQNDFCIKVEHTVSGDFVVVDLCS